VHAPRVATPRTCRRSVGALILLKHTLDTLPALASSLAGVTNPLLAAIRDNLCAQGACLCAVPARLGRFPRTRARVYVHAVVTAAHICCLCERLTA
jgi:hypothetical protein